MFTWHCSLKESLWEIKFMYKTYQAPLKQVNIDLCSSPSIPDTAAGILFYWTKTDKQKTNKQ